MHAMPRLTRPAHVNPLTEVREAIRLRTLMVSATLTGIAAVTAVAAGLITLSL